MDPAVPKAPSLDSRSKGRDGKNYSRPKSTKSLSTSTFRTTIMV